ncbi:MAG TPA: SRPBCC family protein [Mycobacteriales bacterium]|nr:SRPBCC family protein [Mycobacteriales bacterium]
MTTVEESVEVAVPISKAYNQWTQFEKFPQFMEGVDEVRQVDDTHLHWKAEIGGVSREWDAKITEQSPEERVAWTATDGATNSGVVTFHRLDDDATKVMLQLEFEPEGMTEKAADMLGVVKRRANGDLKRFKDFIEGRSKETGAWRGEVPRSN